MSLSTLKPVTGRLPPAAGANASPSKVSNVTMMNSQARPSIQVKEKEKLRFQESVSATSRREMMHLTAASVGLLSLLLPASAEARPRNATMRQKIMEKFEELRQKAGLSKPKDEGEQKKPKDEAEGKSKIPNSVKEMKPNPKDGKKHATASEKTTVPLNEEPSVPALPGIINGKTVETKFP